ncbi:MAG: M3 family metallopeptidase [Bacteroidales bacterium]|nr:M3 family metallopeptidase [Bacteroidales bacterium]
MKKILIIAAAILAMTACRQNPLLSEWDTPYGIPPFESIKISDYKPAIKAGIAQQEKQIAEIKACTEAPSFENTIAALDRSGDILARVSGVLYNVAETENCPEIEKLIDEITPVVSEHSDNIYMDKALFERVAAVWNADQSGLTREQQMLLKKTYRAFERNGIALPEEAQAELRKINSESSVKINKIGNNILAESNAFKAEFGISVSAYPTAMSETADRSLREKMFKAYSSRGHNGGENDNRQLILDVMGMRIRKARIMGYSNPADFILEDKMAHDHGTVDSFLESIMVSAVAKAREEVADMQAVMDRDIAAGLLPAGSKIEPWDWWYYAERVRKEKYALDESQTKPYFEVSNVKKGLFTAANWLYGVNVEPLSDVPVYNPAVETYKVTDADGALIGIFTTDYVPRSSKRGGAWMNNVREQYYDAEGNNVRPIIVNVGNFTAPDENGVALCTVDEVQTAFHEFGHALHGLLSQCHYAGISGTSVARDFVETFSQFNENFAFQPELLAVYAKHYQTGEVIPAELVEKINRASTFNQGFMTTELCAASILDMRWHELESIDGVDIDTFEEAVCRDMGLIDEIIPRYRSTYFNHIFSSGYSAGYYGYLWAEVLDKDLFSCFETNGVWNRDLAMRFRRTFLEKGGSEEPMTLFVSFMGREPDTAPFLRGRGL